METLFWLEDSIVGLTVSSTEWGYPIILSLHAVGMATLVGVALMLSIRVLGFAPSIPVTSMAPYWRVALGGFLLNLLSGSALFCGSASELFFNWAFRIKFVLVFVGLALTGRLVQLCIKRSDEVSNSHRRLAGSAMVTWLVAIGFGRLIGYWVQEETAINTLLDQVITTLNSTALSEFVMTNAYLFPFLEMLHFVGLSLLFGSLIVVDLRVVGFARLVPLNRVNLFVRFALIGFAINLISGALFVIGDSDRYLINIAFWTKMGLIALAGVNTAYFARRIKPQMTVGADSQDLHGGARTVAWLSLTLWTGVIFAGRFIPYVEDL